MRVSTKRKSQSKKMREKTGKKIFFSCILKKNCEGKLFSQVAGVLTGSVLKNVPFKDIFIYYIKIYEIPSAPCDINVIHVSHIQGEKYFELLRNLKNIKIL